MDMFRNTLGWLGGRATWGTEVKLSGPSLGDDLKVRCPGRLFLRQIVQASPCVVWGWTALRGVGLDAASLLERKARSELPRLLTFTRQTCVRSSVLVADFSSIGRI